MFLVFNASRENVLLLENLNDAELKLSLRRRIYGLSFGFKYAVTIMLFGLSLVQQEGSEDEAWIDSVQLGIEV